MNLAVIAKPLRWVAVAGIDVRERDGEVNEVEIEVVKAPVTELFLRQRFDLHSKLLLVWVTIEHEKTSHDHGRGMCSRAKGQSRSGRDPPRNHGRVSTLEVMTEEVNGFDQLGDSTSITQRTYRDLRVSRDRPRWRDEHPRQPASRSRSRQRRREGGNQV